MQKILIIGGSKLSNSHTYLTQHCSKLVVQRHSHTQGRTVIIQIFVYLTFSTDVDAVVDEIALKEPLVTMTKTDQVRKLIIRILSSGLCRDSRMLFVVCY